MTEPTVTTGPPLERRDEPVFHEVDPDQTAASLDRAGPTLEPRSFADTSAFEKAVGLVLDEIAATRVVGHLRLGPEHHTPWGIVHGGVYATAIESAASIGASTAVRGRGQVAVGLTNTTHFLRSVASGTVRVEAVALNQGRSQQLWRVDISEESGRLIAHGEVRLQNLDAGPRRPDRD
jgi:1,4-dihydroxy-2-naphthoyl-CoA hydrolase